MMGWTNGYKDGLISNVRIKYGFMDRIRILVGKTAHVKVITPLREVLADDGHGPTESIANVERVFPRRSIGELHAPERTPQ